MLFNEQVIYIYIYIDKFYPAFSRQAFDPVRILLNAIFSKYCIIIFIIF